MSTATIFYIILAALIAAAVVFFLYYYKSRISGPKRLVLASLRFLSLFLLLLLLIDPIISSREYFIEKPNLILAVDNSASVSFLEQEEVVRSLVDRLREDQQLQERFDLQVISFGTEVTAQEPEFDEPQTNIAALFTSLDKRYSSGRHPVVLISDGNQTVGKEFNFAAKNFGQPVFPVVVGDTTRYRDLGISQINVNKYSFLDNRFPVELMLNYSGTGKVDTYLQISSQGRTLVSRPLSFADGENALIINLEIASDQVGLRKYEAKLIPLEGEKNIQNNTREFAVEVIDQRTSVLIAYSVLHPDLGALKKAISANRQREIEILPVDQVRDQNDFDLVILYQPTAAFAHILGELQSQHRNYWMITGPETDWNFLNRSEIPLRQEISGQQEEFQGRLNPTFDLYQTGYLEFGELPPLTGIFGNLSFSGQGQVLLFRNIEGMETEDPLLMIHQEANARRAFLLGSGIWRWRSQTFLREGDFQIFDDFVGDLVQYLSSDNERDRLSLSYERIMETGEEKRITARFFDSNYVFDPDASLSLTLSETGSGNSRTLPFMLRDNRYEIDLSGLAPGEYDFSVRVEGEGLSRNGSFHIRAFDIEKQFLRANPEALSRIAGPEGVYYPDEFGRIKNDILERKALKPLQKSREIEMPLIEWYFLLILIALCLSLEWFLRKYYGQL